MENFRSANNWFGRIVMQQLTKNVFTETKIRGCNPSIVFTSEGSVFIDTAQWITTLLEMRKFAH